jgi:hypothetical protein
MGIQTSKLDMVCHYCYQKIMLNEPLVKVYSNNKLDGLIMCRKCLFSPTRRYNMEVINKDIKDLKDIV